MAEQLTLEQRATNYETMRHVEQVRNLLNVVVRELLARGEAHDQSKMRSPEVEGFTEYTPKLAGCTYGSQEYEGYRKALGPALTHHYAKNRHHPEHFKDVNDGEAAHVRELLNRLHGLPRPHDPALTEAIAFVEGARKQAESSVGNMNLLDLVEMFCDWKAATMRHDDGNLRKSIAHNAVRFGINPQLVKIMENTADLFDK